MIEAGESGRNSKLVIEISPVSNSHTLRGHNLLCALGKMTRVELGASAEALDEFENYRWNLSIDSSYSRVKGRTI